MEMKERRRRRAEEGGGKIQRERGKERKVTESEKDRGWEKTRLCIGDAQ
jgi:hypothetical protein